MQTCDDLDYWEHQIESRIEHHTAIPATVKGGVKVGCILANRTVGFPQRRRRSASLPFCSALAKHQPALPKMAKTLEDAQAFFLVIFGGVGHLRRPTPRELPETGATLSHLLRCLVLREEAHHLPHEDMHWGHPPSGPFGHAVRSLPAKASQCWMESSAPGWVVEPE
jgi:hypothetical protein